MPDDAMPADPFKEGQADWGPLASGCAGLFSALVARGMSEPHALDLTGRYLHLMMSAMFAQAAQQQEPGEAGLPCAYRCWKHPRTGRALIAR